MQFQKIKKFYQINNLKNLIKSFEVLEKWKKKILAKNLCQIKI